MSMLKSTPLSATIKIQTQTNTPVSIGLSLEGSACERPATSGLRDSFAINAWLEVTARIAHDYNILVAVGAITYHDPTLTTFLDNSGGSAGIRIRADKAPLWSFTG
jgi:hypothetical protein